MAILNVGAKEPYTTIASAVSAASSGDTILIDAGIYKTKDILLTKSLTIEAAGNGPVVLHASGPVAKGMLIAGSTSTAPNITIEGLTFTGAKSPSQNGAGIRYQNGKSDSEQRHVQQQPGWNSGHAVCCQHRHDYRSGQHIRPQRNCDRAGAQSLHWLRGSIHDDQQRQRRRHGWARSEIPRLQQRY